LSSVIQNAELCGEGFVVLLVNDREVISRLIMVLSTRNVKSPLWESSWHTAGLNGSIWC